jgi:small subunit ribosomal protein S4
MGAPNRNRRKYDRPSELWDLERIKSDRALMNEYGLKNLKELWKAETEIAKVRRNARLMLSGASSHVEENKGLMIDKLSRLSIASKGATLDSVLDLNERALLERRLQTIVFKRGMAVTIKQARQLITHGFIAIEGKRVNKPGYIVDASTESKISYYKPIEIRKKEMAAPVHAETKHEEAHAEEAKAEAAAPEKKEK